MFTKYLALSILFFITCNICFSNALNLPAPLTDKDFRSTTDDRNRLGQQLFFDPILSGNKNIACSTCHHPDFSTADGVSLSLGEGGKGLGTERTPNTKTNRPEQRIGRNAPALFNLGAKEFKVLFHDGRLEADTSRSSGIRTPLENDMMQGFDSILSAQSMFPVLSPDEMAGHYGENDISRAVRMGLITGKQGAWQKIAERVQAIPEYVIGFKQAIPRIQSAEDIAFTDISNVIADFIASEWKAIDSPFDRYLKGDKQALSAASLRGMTLFYGKANCNSCHSGALQTNHGFHSIATPEFGPGKVARFESTPQDFGRMRVTGKAQDRYRFRTPSLRNVALTAPYTHNGAYRTLQGIVRHHLDPAIALNQYQLSTLILSPLPEQDKKDLDMKRLKSVIPDLLVTNELKTISLEEQEISDLIAFLHALTDSAKGNGVLGKPSKTPSGLPMD